MKFKLLASSLLMAGAFALSGAVSVANANLLTIETITGSSEQEHSGDAGGTQYPWPGTSGGGAGLPSENGGWPTLDSNGNQYPGFSSDSTAGGGLGASGYDASYLKLSEAGNVTFQFMGAGDSVLRNSFWINPTYDATNPVAGWIKLFQDDNGDGTGTDPIKVSGNPPLYSGTAENQITVWLPAGYIHFAYGINGDFDPNAADRIENDGTHNPTDLSGSPGYLLAVDPYLATGEPDISGKAVFVGLADGPRPGDHDYQDMGVRISVPEPGILALLMAGLLGFGVLRRRQAASDAVGLLA